jgi:[acyl-carrier-protein] S-malonyltransferase
VSQPAIFVCSMAAIEKLRADPAGSDAIDAATCAMGLSLGEYSALCFADALSFEDGVRITKARGEAMQASIRMVTHTAEHFVVAGACSAVAHQHMRR